MKSITIRKNARIKFMLYEVLINYVFTVGVNFRLNSFFLGEMIKILMRVGK